MSEEKGDGSSSEDEELNIASSRFNPLKALYTKNIKFPVKNVKKFDNLSIFISRLKKADNNFEAELTKLQPSTSHKSTQPIKEPAQEVDEESDLYHVTAAGRRFLKEQAPVHRGKKAKYKRDLLIRMENSKGPISLLQKFRMNRTKVLIYVRKEHGIRGTITGYLEAFDKHYNLALTDCTETWKRRKYSFSEAKVIQSQPPQDCTNLLLKMGIKLPTISVKSINRKYVECTRQIGQLMIRGEDVVLISEYKS